MIPPLLCFAGLAMLPAQPGLQYSYGQDGYLFSRSDHVVIGGTFEVGVNNRPSCSCRRVFPLRGAHAAGDELQKRRIHAFQTLTDILCLKV